MRWLYLSLLLSCAAAPRRVPIEELLTPPLGQVLERFEQQSQEARKTSAPGAPMPPSQREAWAQLLDLLEGREPEPQLHAWLARAFEADAQHFGDLPAGTSERVLACLRQLVPARREPGKRVNPRAFAWPVAPLTVSSPYGTRLHPIHGEVRFHAGIDLEVPLAHPVLASFDGVVTFSGWNGGHGRQVELQHDPRWLTRYSHLSKVLVEPGMTVRKGDLIALAGQSGLATGPHVHFELLRDGDALDPEQFLTELP